MAKRVALSKRVRFAEYEDETGEELDEEKA